MTTATDTPTPAAAPTVFQAIALAMRDTVPVRKDQRNDHQRYNFRGIDDVMSAVAGPFRNHGVFIVPEVVSRSAEQRGKMVNVVVTVRYRIYGPAGDHVEAVVPGEASDTADKATNKALSAAFKYLLFQVLMIPVDARSIEDGDRHHPENEAPQQAEQQPRRSRRAEPGPWEQDPPPQQPQGPSRNYLAEARAAADVAAVRALYDAAKGEGAPADYLAQLAEIGASKPGAKPRQQQRGAVADTPRRAMEWTKGHQSAAVDEVTDAAGEASWQGERAQQEHAAAVVELYDAAKTAGLSGQEADEAFEARYQKHPYAATVAQLREMRDDLLDAAKGGAA
ncbi:MULTISPECIES: ERF family protein [Streptomyces]|uniref:ERF family protein n=1 Tax=Streptomyces TaxID=1883 RepID=UPI00068DF5DD|nr:MULTISPECIES: ERF family protein [Streptomyces]